VVLSYEILERARWTLGERSVELLRVRRLDTINVEMGLLGHAGGDQPVVLMDRLEAQLSDELPEAYDEKARGNEIDRAARKLWRGLVGSRAGDGALQRAAEGLARREELFKVMETRLRGGSVRVPKPERLLYGAEFFDALKPYTDSGRRGGPLLLPGDLRDLRRADEALREGDARAALEAALDLEAHVTEAHEARHALLDFVGEDDLDFAASAERELRAYIGEIHDAAAPACLSVQKIARTAGGARARRTPHFFAGHVLLRALFFAGLPKDAGPAAGAALPGGGEPKEPELLEVLCALPDDVLRARAAAAYRRFYERPFVGAVRAKERTSP
jgi:hypothetical protein